MGTAQGRTIAIDGPGASGKNTVGLLLAERLNCRFVDSGAMYRAVTLRAMEQGIASDDETALSELARRLSFTFLPPSPEAPDGRILVDGEDVTEAIHTPAVDALVSQVALIPAVREILVRQQQALAEEGPVVMVGRDIGTVVLPDADLKVYLDASAQERAVRRYRQLAGEGEDIALATVLAGLERRDRIDREREASPLRPADDAVVVLTDGLTPERVVDGILERLRAGGSSDG